MAQSNPNYSNSEFSLFPSRRSVVTSTKGIVAASQTLASAAGVKILEKGGNAADAAVAAAAVLAIVEPSSTGVGGDMFAIFYSAKDKKVYGINGSGRSSRNISLEYLKKQGFNGNELPPDSIHTVTVPGAVSGWLDTLKIWGTGLPVEEILKPAIELAENGFVVNEISANMWTQEADRVINASPNYNELLPHKKAPLAGTIFKNQNYANVLKRIAKDGFKGFYSGETASSIVQTVQQLGGLLDLQDLASHKSTFVEPIYITYRGLNIWEIPPNGQGLIALLTLGMIRELENAHIIPDLKQLHLTQKSDNKYAHNSTQYLHLLIELLKLGFKDGQEYISDPTTYKIPVDQLLSSKYLLSRAKTFNPDKANKKYSYGVPDPTYKGDTVYCATSDKEGNACSFINSLYQGFGSGVIPKGTGFALQNRGANFSLNKDKHNVIAPNKRPYHTIIPSMITYNDSLKLFASFGVMGGFMQPQGHVQVVLNTVIFGFNPQEALDAPRVCISPGEETIDGLTPVKVLLEDGIPPETVKGLSDLGHDVKLVKDFDRAVFGRGQIIRAFDSNGQNYYCAGSDLRGDGAAIPQV